MKRYFLPIICLMLIAVIGCNDVPSSQQLKKLETTNIDADAGNWTYILPAVVNVNAPAAPAAATSPAYLAELQTIKDLQAGLNDPQKEAIEYWSAGGILRWNEILRGLVAKYNLPPAPLPNGTYPGPDAENPFGDPNFPFANPPYAARAYAYVTAAQYDAMKAAWRFKYQFDRPAPYNADSGIEALMTKTSLPGYPSEDAVMSGVTAEILKLMFPASVEEITIMAAQQRNAALWSGKAAPSDIAAGLQLGKDISALFITRARGDRMGASGGNKAIWEALKTNATGRGDEAWISLEDPQRPPMLPLFGLRNYGGSPTGVLTWMITDAQLVAERPAPPPLKGTGEMVTETEEVKWYTTHLTRERLAIVHKWADGAGTSTPSGHWNEIMSHEIEAANFSEVRAARAFALLNVAQLDAAVGCWETKFFYFNPRPSQLDPTIKTGTGIPNFPAYTSGHSTFSGSAATILEYLFPGPKAAWFQEQAMEAGLSRLYGGIHYRKDCEAGLAHGKRLASYTVNFALADGAD
jgi:hypothetical protein